MTPRTGKARTRDAHEERSEGDASGARRLVSLDIAIGILSAIALLAVVLIAVFGVRVELIGMIVFAAGAGLVLFAIRLLR